MDPTTLRLIQGAAGAAGEATYVDDVFSTFLYEGNSSTQTITNNIDFSGEGGLAWIRTRAAGSSRLIDTERGATKRISSDNSNAEATDSTGLTSFTSTGFTLGNGGDYNDSNDYISWSFRKAPGFLDIVTYTGDGSNRAIAHNLGSKPGFMIIKSLDSSSYWRTYNQARGATNSIVLNENFAENTFSAIFNDTEPTATHFTVGTDDSVNKSGDNFVAYLFGHNDQSFGTDSDEAIIKCATASYNTFENLGFEPQWLLLRSIGSDNWYIYDTMRGLPVDGPTPYLMPNLTNAENTSGSNQATITSQGFTQNIAPTCIYVAIRRPNKPPTAGTDVFTPIFQSMGTNMTTGFPVDLLVNKSNFTGTNNYVLDRTRGPRSTLISDTNGAQYTGWTQDAFPLDNNTGVDAPYWGNPSDTGSTHLFRRATGFLDVVAYTGTGSSSSNTGQQNITHNLGAVPELIIVKTRDGANDWVVYNATSGAGSNMRLNRTNASASDIYCWDNTTPTSSVFRVGSDLSSPTNSNTKKFIAYLFATLNGISKVGSYTGTGSDLDVDCGFSAGARYILIKRTDSTGGWYVFDAAMGITSGNVYYWFYDTNGAVVTTTDYIDPLNSGFTVTSSAPAELNASGGTYIFLAIA